MTFISLKEASTLCEYSQEYLRLRARHGKLLAKKQGKNWVTTAEWVQDYARSAKTGKKMVSVRSAVGGGPKKEIAPPANLPFARTLQPLVFPVRMPDVPEVSPRDLGSFAIAFAVAIVMISFVWRSLPLIQEYRNIYSATAATVAESFTADVETLFQGVDSRLSNYERSLERLIGTDSSNNASANSRGESLEKIHFERRPIKGELYR
jgi:hypothetical protein